MKLRAFVLLAGCRLALVPASGQSFDVTSVKLVAPGPAALESGCSPDGRFVARGDTLRRTILWAFDIKAFQLKNLPAWIDTVAARYDIEAKAARDITQAECKQMVRQLLADRFQLRTHMENQPAKVVLLVTSKDGPKMPRPVEGSDESGVKLTINGQPVQRPPGAPSDLKPPAGWTMAQLADALGIAFAFDGARPVIDRTGLDGLFRITLDFGFDLPGRPRDLEYRDVFSAVKSLGLELQERTEPFPMLFIDKIERPDSN